MLFEEPDLLEFEVKIDSRPVPKGSVRFNGQRGFLPQKTRVGMHDVKMLSSVEKDRMFAAGQLESLTDPVFTKAVEATIIYSFLRPKSVKPSKRPHPCVKPDIDNLTKLLFDGLQPHILADDCLVCKVRKKKIYSESEYTWILIKELPA